MGIFTREKGIYAFGPFRLDPVRRTLFRGNDRVKLTARLFDTLLCLVENHDRLVERNELQNAVWQGRAVDEANLGQAISALRKALQAAGATEGYIVTVAGRGFRFGAPVLVEPDRPPGPVDAPDAHELADPGSTPQYSSPAETASQSHIRRTPQSRARVAGLAMILALGAVGFVGWQLLKPSSHREPVLMPAPARVADTTKRNIAMTMAAKSGASAPWTEGHTLRNSRLTFLFGSSVTGYTTANADRVDSIVWIDSSGRAVSNYIVQADRHCDDAIEYFGEAYGNGKDARPYALIHGATSIWSGRAETAGSTVVTSGCSLSLDAITKSHYELFENPELINAVKIDRTIKFAKSAATGDMRAYVVRVPVSTYPYVVYPDDTNTLHAVHVVLCSDNCVITNWNGKWMADDTGGGKGIAIFRQPNAALQTEITVDYDDDSASNASAITFVGPAAGWSGHVIAETEYLCFYDATSWTRSERAAGIPPAGCAGVPH